MKLFLIDGHALIFKMYYAFLGRPMVNSKGVDTSILFGFTKYLLDLIEREKPTHLAVSFDPPGGTFRNEMYPAYKANRGETPQLVIDALDPLASIVKAMDIPVLMIKGFEADDVIGSAAIRFRSEGFEVYMVTPDKDYGQLVRPGIFQYRPGKAGENEVMGPEQICAKWGIDSTSQVVDILALCGDSADNVPGVAGIGPVGASKLLKKYGSLEGIYAHLDELTPSQKSKFEAARDHIALSKRLVTIKTDIPIDVDADSMKLSLALTPELSSLLALYEFGSLRRHFNSDAKSAVGPFNSVAKPASGASASKGLKFGEMPFEADAPEAAIPQGLKFGEMPFEADAPAVTTAAPCTVGLRFDEQSLTLTVCSDDGVNSGSPKEFAAMLSDEKIAKCGHSLKPLLRFLLKENIEIKGEVLDAELLHYLINPESSHSLESLALSLLGEELSGDVQKVEASLFDVETPSRDLAKEARIVRGLCPILRSSLESSGMFPLYAEIEAPLQSVLARMENCGVRIEPAALKEFADSLRSRMLGSEARVRELTGVPTLNVSSPKQIGEVLFEKMKIAPEIRRPRRGSYPTDEQTLAELSSRSPVIDEILEYRGLRKLLSTYIDPLPSYISNLDGRVHTSFNQALTSTGRLSSSNPNLQNIPIRTEQGREIRKAFIPSEGYDFMMSADYSQIELRVMAHMCGDIHMTEAFRSGADVHSATAAKIFRESLSSVTPEQRRVAKTVNFGIMYGMSAFGLSQRLGCSRSEAKGFIDDYFASFPSIRTFIEDTLDAARRNGYVETLFGRRRYISGINSNNAQMRALSERNAVNAPVQGSAADIIKLAMIAVDKALGGRGLRSRMVLQIHDELLLEVPRDELDTLTPLLVSNMEGVTELSVPLEVECNYGKNWLDAH